MNLSVLSREGARIIRLSERLNQTDAGELYDILLSETDNGRVPLILEMSGVDHISRGAARAIIVAGKLAQTNRGGMRVCGAHGHVAGLLEGLGYAHVQFERTVEAARQALLRTPLNSSYPEVA